MSTTTTALQAGQNAAKENIDRTMSGLKEGVAGATAGMEQAQAGVRDGMAKVMKTAEDVVSFSQGNFEALTRSSQIFATGMQDIAQMWAAAAKSSMDETMGVMRAMTGVKSVKEAFDLQSTLVRSTMEKAVSQTGQMAESGMKLSEQTFAPITARVALATEKFSRIG